MRAPTERLRDILDAIERIERYTSQGRAAFDNDELIQNWVVRHLQIIGEAANALPEETRALDATVPWRNIIRQAETEPGTTTVTLTRGKLTFVVRDVPARVCPNCGEAYIEEAAAAHLLATAEQLARAGTQVDVREYVAA